MHISAQVDELSNNVYDTPECRVKISDEMSDEYIIDFDKRMLKNLKLEVSPYFNSESFSEISDCEFETLPYKRIRK